MDTISNADGAPAVREQDPQLGACPTPSGRHSLLRAATRQAHAQLDALVTASGALASPLAFASHVRALAKFYASYDREMGRVCPDWLQVWGNSASAAALRVDLEAARGQAGAVMPPPAADVPFHLASRCEGLGALYVVTGSALGARVLHRMSVEKAIPGAGGSAYFAAMAQGPAWGPFLAFLESAALTSTEALVQGAQATFAAVTAHVRAEAIR